MPTLVGSGISLDIQPTDPQAAGVSGTIAHDNTITISALGGEDFGTKPDPDSRGTAKPLLVWRAQDNSASPNSTLGDLTVFSSALNGSFTSDFFAQNSVRSRVLDGGWDNDELGSFITSSMGTWDKFYVFRREMINRTAEDGELYRTRTDDGDTGLISVGDWGRSQTSPNATGKVEGVSGTTVYWDNDFGDIAKPRATADQFSPAPDETDIDIYATEAEADTGIGTIIVTIHTNDGFFGTPFRTFNSKIIRWNFETPNNNFYFGDHPSNPTQAGFVATTTVENTGATSISSQNYTNELSTVKVANEWHNREFLFIDGTVDVSDGIALIYRNGVLAFSSSDKKFIFKSTANPNQFDNMSHHQNDSLWKKGTLVYQDYLYLDDSPCRVFIADSPTLNIDSTASTAQFKGQVCPIVSWSSDTIECVVQQGDLPDLFDKTIHVVDSASSVITSRLTS